MHIQCIITEKRQNKINILYTMNQRKKMALNLRDRAKENLKLSHGGPSQRQTPGTNQPMNV